MSSIDKNIYNPTKADAILIPGPSALLAQLTDHY